ncbi:hypothetical protein ACMT9Y_15410 [Clavibacter tessellarius]|uniref:hypothetical protein n=1 Tax=Clavibacter tessellarius TaxID=31965 RepID=UPI0039E81C2A
MELLIAAVFGLSVGHLLGGAKPLRYKWTPTVAAAVVLGVVAYEIVVHRPELALAGVGVVIVFSVVLGSLLTEAAALRDHPLTADMGFATRLRFAFTQRRLLREYDETLTETEPASQATS